MPLRPFCPGGSIPLASSLRVRPAHGLFVPADELGDLESSQQPVRQRARCGRGCLRELPALLSVLRIRIRALPHGVLRGARARAPAPKLSWSSPSRWAPPRVKDHEIDHPSAAGSEDRRHADLKPRMPSSWSSLASNQLLLSALADDVRSNPHPGAGDCPVRVDVPMTLSCALRDEKVARRPFCADFPGPWWLRFVAAGPYAEPQSSASRVVCRCLECPQAASGVSNGLRP
jgi:hypothetical protein